MTGIRPEAADGDPGLPHDGLHDTGIPGKLTLLRPVEPEDAALLRYLMNDPAVTSSIVGFNTPVSLQQQHDWIARPRGGPEGPWHFTIVERSTGDPVGLASVHDIDWREGTARGGIKLHPSAHGRGLAFDAWMARDAWVFFIAGFRRLEANVLDFNIATQKQLIKYGYTLEGRRRQAVQRNGRWCDVLIYGLLRSEVEEMPAMQDYRHLIAPEAPSTPRH